MGIIAFLQGSNQALVLPQQFENFHIGTITQRAQNDSNGQFACTVDPHPQHIIGVGFVLQPCATVGDYSRGIQVFSSFVDRVPIVHTRGAYQLAYDNALSTIDDEGAVLRHKGKVTHENV